MAIRVLVHDTAKSRSLLTQLDLKETPFVDTAAPMNPKNLLTEASLVGMATGDTGLEYWAPLDDHPYGERHAPFAEWWVTPVIRDEAKNLFTRQQVVLTAANQAGGAHVDPELDEAYARLSSHNTMGWVVTHGEGEGPLLGVELATIRQISHEVLKTLDPSYEAKPATSRSTFRNVTVEKLPGRVQGRKVGRNEPCHCGSGKKYKRCHGSSAR